MHTDPTFTVFTPAYNAEKFLHRVFNSLKSQTYKDFEWIVVNDGSSDNTHGVIQDFIRQADFPVRYFNFPENRMLTVSYNLAIREAKGFLFLPFGHDDEMVPKALEVILETWKKYGNDGISGVSSLCVNQEGKIIGDHFPESPWISNFIDVVYNRKIKCEKFGCLRTDILKTCILPEDIDTYVSEDLMWFAIGAKYQMIYINDPLRIYYVNQPGYSNLSTVDRKKFKYPRGKRYYTLTVINNYLPKIHDYKYKIRLYLHYIRFSRHTGHKFAGNLSSIKTIPSRIMVFLLYPAGLLLAKRDRMRGKI
jgi:glycosyltransferase involved in cell wall biosynthesis